MDGFNQMLQKTIVAALLLSAAPSGLVSAQGLIDPTSASTPMVSSTQEMMGKIFSSVALVLPLSLSAKKFEDPAKRDLISTALRDLAENATVLEGHGATKDESFSFLSGSLAFDSREIYERFAQGKFNQSRYLLQHLTENCVACHTRLPSSDSAKAERFLTTIDMGILSTLERAKLQTALRQFDSAMTSYEAAILSSDYAPAMLGLSDTIVDYLVVAIRVKSDLIRAAKTLNKFSKRTDLPLYLSHNVEEWSSSLRKIDKRKTAPKSSLVEAKRLIEAGKKMMMFPADRQGLVYNLVASSILHRYLESGSPTKDGASEAYFLLGTSEAMSGRELWASPSAHYLEASIRLNPKSSFAKKSYTLLEEALVFENSGSSGVHLPKEAERKLNELRKMVHQK